MEHVIGTTAVRIEATGSGGHWTASAVSVDTGDRFGIEWSASSEADARGGLIQWLEWQHDHAAALVELQRAQHTYHKAVADHAFEGESGPGREVQRATLDGVDAARQRLDAVRQRRPVPA